MGDGKAGSTGPSGRERGDLPSGRERGDLPSGRERQDRTLVARARGSVRDRVVGLAHNALPLLQAGVAAGLAWWVARDVVGHQQPFFAPIAAVITLGIALGQRLRRTVELVVGVAIGIAIADALVALIGTGPVQIGVVVVLAMAAAVALRGGPLLISQAASSAALVVTLTPAGHGVGRWVDALIGGGVGFAVHALLLPVNPLTPIRRAARPLFAGLADGLDAVTDALESGDPDAARAALEALRGLDATYRRFSDAVRAGGETVAVAPARWRSRGRIAAYARAAPHLDLAVRNSRVVARRAETALRAGEPVPPHLVRALRTLAAAVRSLAAELGDDIEPDATRNRALAAIRELAAVGDDAGFSGRVVQAQARSIAYDLLQASGLDSEAALRSVHRAWDGAF